MALGGTAVTTFARMDDWKQGAAVIGTLLGGVATSPWMRTTLKAK